MKIVLLAVALCATDACAKESRVVKIVGTVVESYVADVSKTAKVENLYTYLTITVERTDPADVKSKLKETVRFVRQGQFEEYPKGTRLEVTSSFDPARPDAPLSVREIRKL